MRLHESFVSDTNCVSMSFADPTGCNIMVSMSTSSEPNVPSTSVTSASHDKDNGQVTSQNANLDTDRTGLFAAVATLFIVLLGVIIIVVVAVLVVKIR